MFNDIKDKVCVLTGGCGVFGSVFSMALINAGAKLAILDYKQGRCESCVQGIAKAAHAIIPYKENIPISLIPFIRPD